VKVGIEHPILGLMTFTLIAAMVVSAIVLLGMVGMNFQDYVLKTPITEGYATCFSQSFDSETGRYKYNVSIAVANSGRVDLRLEKLYVATEEDEDLVELTVASQHTVRTGVTVGDAVVDFEIILLGFTTNTELWAGQRGLIRINMVSDKQLYMRGGQYSVTAYLTTIGFEAFAVREARFKVGEIEECPLITSPPPLPLNIVRVSRSALYWDTFDTNPINSRLILVQEAGAHCEADHLSRPIYSGNGLVYLLAYGHCALLVQGVPLPNIGSIYTAFTAFIDFGDSGVGFGAILTEDLSLTKYYTGGFDTFDRLFVKVKTPAATAVSSTRYRVQFGRWYDGVLALFYAQPNIPDRIEAYGGIRIWASKSLAPYEYLIPYFTGLSTETLPLRKCLVYFDNILVTVDIPPWIVIVEGLQPGWMVVLKDGSGNVIDSETAAGVFVELNVWGVWIIEDGSIEVYDSLGNLLSQRVFPEILGGDVYRVTG
jgi:hypothetical protein